MDSHQHLAEVIPENVRSPEKGAEGGPLASEMGTVTALRASWHSKDTREVPQSEPLPPRTQWTQKSFFPVLCSVWEMPRTRFISETPEPVFLCGQLDLQLLPAPP